MASKAGDPRLRDLLLDSKIALEAPTTDKKTIALIGYPCDEGVRRNQGRVGAQEGPKTLRQRLWSTGTLVNPELNIDVSHRLHLVDLGDVESWATLEEAHNQLQGRVELALRHKFIPIVVGGGNDQSYPNASALMSYSEEGIRVVNIDAHLDVRPLLSNGSAHSGSPFYQLLTNKTFQSRGGRFVEFAAQGSQCSKEHADFVTTNGGTIHWLSSVQARGAKEAFLEVLEGFGTNPIFVSFDIDSIQAADCPGVSAPSPVGLTASEAISIAFESGKNPFVRMIDFSEFNPVVESDRTCRLLSQLIYHFCLGVGSREQ